MEIREITHDKKRYLDLLLLGDEQEDMIDRYLECGRMFVLFGAQGEAVGECVVTDEGGGVLELKNIAVLPAMQRRGYGRMLIDFAAREAGGSYNVLRAGTGDTPLSVPFYESCGFTECGRIKNFFTDNYDHLMIEGGVLLTDMVIFERPIKSN